MHGDRTFVAPLALTVFCWVALMNSIDLIPVDLFPAIAGLIGLDHLRPLPTADLNGPSACRWACSSFSSTTA